MSLINDALKQAQKNQPSASTPPPSGGPIRPSSLPPVPAKPERNYSWVMPSIVILLIVAAIFILGWTSSHRAVETIVASPPQTEVKVIEDPVAPVPPIASAASTPEPVAETLPADLPRLQGIFYSPTAPSAIIDGKSYRAGERVGQYRIRQINKTTVIIVDANGKTAQLTMN